MVRKRTYRTNKGANIDMEAMRTANEKTIAAGNMSVNAKGDIVQGGVVIKTAKERSKERYEAPKRVAQASLKKPLTQAEGKVNPEVEIVPEPTPIPEAEITTETIRTREDGSRFSETINPEGDIEVKEVREPTKKVAKKKASKKKRPSV